MEEHKHKSNQFKNKEKKNKEETIHSYKLTAQKM